MHTRTYITYVSTLCLCIVYINFLCRSMCVCLWVCVSMCVCLDLERKARLSLAYKAFAALNMQHFAALCKLFDFPALSNTFHGLFQKKSTL